MTSSFQILSKPPFISHPTYTAWNTESFIKDTTHAYAMISIVWKWLENKFHFCVKIMCKSGLCPTYSDIYLHASAHVVYYISETISTAVKNVLDFFFVMWNS
jgi:hypothetical protein